MAIDATKPKKAAKIQVPKTFKGAETTAFNRANKLVQITGNQLLKVYQAALIDIELRIAAYNNNPTKQLQSKRFIKLQTDIQKRVTELTTSTRKDITFNYYQVYSKTRNQQAYWFTKWVNTKTGIPEGVFYDLGYKQINRIAILSSFREEIGASFAQNYARMRGEIRQSVQVATTLGLSAKETANNIKAGLSGLNNALTKAENWDMRIARTELLKAYSLAQEDAANQAEIAGVDIAPTWDATLDGKTRQTHATADGRAFKLVEGVWQITVGGVCFTAPRVVCVGQSGGVKEIVNCRCYKRNNPFGFTPTSRVARLEEGDWAKVEGNLTYTKWAQTREGKDEIAAAAKERALRAQELRIVRNAKNQDRDLTTTERKKLAELRKFQR